MRRRIVVIEGDGIGPEVIRAALTVLHAVAECDEIGVELDRIEAGARTYLETGKSISDEDLERIRYADATLKGPVGDPAVRLADGTEAGLLGGMLRADLDCFANVRPIRLLPGVRAPVIHEPGQIDYVIVRENTEGLYASRGLGVGNKWAYSDTLLVTRPGIERVVHRAFEIARSRNGAPVDGKQRVTCVDKANVLRSFAYFRSIFDEVAYEYPDIESDHIYSDAAAQALVLEPWRFDVLVMENFLGDILSDLGGGTVGGIGLCPSANVGAGVGYFEPIHGSAPTLAGTNLANPIAQILTVALLLDDVGLSPSGDRIRKAVWNCLAEGDIVINSDGSVAGGTRETGEAIAERLC